MEVCDAINAQRETSDKVALTACYVDLGMNTFEGDDKRFCDAQYADIE